MTDILDTYPAKPLPPVVKHDIELPDTHYFFREAGLTDEEIKAIYCIVIKSMSFRDAARITKMSLSTIWRRHESAIKKLQQSPKIKRVWELYVLSNQEDNNNE